MWSHPQFPVDLFTFTVEILSGKLIFCTVLDSKIRFFKSQIHINPFGEQLLQIRYKDQWSKMTTS